MGAGGGHRVVLRLGGPREDAGGASAEGARWSADETGRQVAERGRDGGRAPLVPRIWHATGRSDLAIASEHLPARGARRVVRARRAATALGPGRAAALRGRLCGHLRAGRRCASSDGRAAEAIRQVRIETPPREDPVGTVPKAGKLTELFGARERRRRDVRPAGLHALLGSVAQGELGGETENGVHAAEPRVETNPTLVSRQQTRAAGQPAPNPRSEGERALRLLRRHGERTSAFELRPLRRTHVEEVARTPQQQGPQLGTHDEAAGSLSAATTSHRAFSAPSRERISDLTSRMREIRKSGSVGAPGGSPPGATRRSPVRTTRRGGTRLDWAVIQSG